MTDTTASERGKSKQQIGEEKLGRLGAWLDAQPAIPYVVRNGVPEANITAIGGPDGANVGRTWCYNNPRAMQLIEGAVTAKGLAMPDQPRVPGGDPVPAEARQRIKALEEQLAVARAEARELRAKLEHYDDIERHMIATGMVPR